MIGTLVLLHLVASAAQPSFSAQQVDRDLRAAMLAAEDARAEGPRALAPLLRGLRSRDPETQRMAVRALGRLERVSLVPSILPLLSSASPAVRAEAANALGQAVFRDDASPVASPLIDRLLVEADPGVGGAIAHTLGRLPYQTVEEMRTAEQALLAYSRHAPVTGLLGIARGLESLLRRQAGTNPPSAQTVARLTQLAREGLESSDVQVVRVRRLAVAALVESGRATPDLLRSALSDRDDEVRRLAARGVQALTEPPRDLIDSGLADPAARVRFEALRAHAAHAGGARCAPILERVEDRDAHVALQALDLLATCNESPAAIAVLDSVAGTLRPDSGAGNRGWHRPAHALVALAELSPERTPPHVEAFIESERWQPRMYAARAATALENQNVLERLAFDDDANVRERAIAGLADVVGHRGDSAYLAALTSPDYQLVRTAARALEGTTRGEETVEPLLVALARITAQRRETSRDPRRAILDRLGELGGPAQADALRAYLTDFDPVIASAAAEYLSAWTGEPVVAMPGLLDPVPLPTLDELSSLDRGRAVIRMASGGSVTLRLFASDAPTNTARFARLAETGYFNGLTFHRVAPNFVIQGGSPGANEFMGAGAYTRDEITARSHLRGTVGISTRGRDTGDAQIFVNLADNVRLDHNYTIIGEVVSGMELIDAVVEGDVMETVTVQTR